MKNEITISQGGLQHIPAAHALVVELAVYEKEPDAVTATVEDYLTHFKEGRFQLIVAEENDKVVGMALFYPTYSTWKGKMMHLEDFVVTASHRRRGIGELLFKAFLKEAKRQGSILTRWQVLDWNTPAIAFYEKIGATIERNWWNGKLYF